MVKRSSKPKKRPTDENQLAKMLVDFATGDDEPKAEEKPEKNPAAVALGRLGGKKGGPARAKKLSKKKRSDIAKKAAKARWSDSSTKQNKKKNKEPVESG